MLLDVSQTQTDTPPGTGGSTSGPGFSGPSTDEGDVPAKEFNNWGTWDWDE